MMRRSLLTCLFVLIATTTLAALPTVNPADILTFMHQLWDRAAELRNDKTDPAIRRARFQQLFHEDFDGLAPGGGKPPGPRSRVARTSLGGAQCGLALSPYVRRPAPDPELPSMSPSGSHETLR